MKEHSLCKRTFQSDHLRTRALRLYTDDLLRVRDGGLILLFLDLNFRHLLAQLLELCVGLGDVGFERLQLDAGFAVRLVKPTQ